jgi:hypothetical protein
MDRNRLRQPGAVLAKMARLRRLPPLLVSELGIGDRLAIGNPKTYNGKAVVTARSSTTTRATISSLISLEGDSYRACRLPDYRCWLLTTTECRPPGYSALPGHCWLPNWVEVAVDGLEPAVKHIAVFGVGPAGCDRQYWLNVERRGVDQVPVLHFTGRRWSAGKHRWEQKKPMNQNRPSRKRLGLPACRQADLVDE